MKESSDVTALVWDHGLFLPLALRLSQFYKRVLYHKPGTEAFPTLNRGCIGDGFEQIECINDPWPLIDRKEIDLAVFPDILDSGAQLHLESLGIPVWGSRKGDSIELSREKFLNILKNNNLDAPTYQRVVGITALKDTLKDESDKYVKISRWRGSMETWHYRSWGEDENTLDVLSVKFGPLREMVPFLVFDPIDTDIEDGSDFICIDGQWPSMCLRGIECKDKGYFSSVTNTSKLPDYLTELLDVFGPVLKEYRYRNLFSMEVRVQDDKAFFIDPCCRGPLPATGSQMMVWSNFGDVVWAGAHGELIEPEPSGMFTAECVLTMKGDKDHWRVLDSPKELEPWMKIADCCMVDDKLGVPPDDQHGNEIGWLVSTGDTPTETIENLKEHASSLPDGVEAHIESLVDLVQEAEKMKQEGIAITKEPMPELSNVITES